MCKRYGYVRVSTVKQSIERQIKNIKDQYPDAVIVTDEYTGTKLDRPGWTKLYKAVKPGDTIVFDEVSRMSRDADEGFAVYEDLYRRGVNLIFIKEPHISTSVYRQQAENQIQKIQIQTGKEAIDKCLSGIMDAVSGLIMDLAREQIRLAFDQAEKEVEYLHQRTREGLREVREKNERLILEYGSEEEARKSPEWKQQGQVKGSKLTTKKSVAAKELIRKHSKDFGGSLEDPEVIKLIGCARNSYYKYKREIREGV